MSDLVPLVAAFLAGVATTIVGARVELWKEERRRIRTARDLRSLFLAHYEELRSACQRTVETGRGRDDVRFHGEKILELFQDSDLLALAPADHNTRRALIMRYNRVTRVLELLSAVEDPPRAALESVANDSAPDFWRDLGWSLPSGKKIFTKALSGRYERIYWYQFVKKYKLRRMVRSQRSA